jgi:hypothetical protein
MTRVIVVVCEAFIVMNKITDYSEIFDRLEHTFGDKKFSTCPPSRLCNTGNYCE